MASPAVQTEQKPTSSGSPFATSSSTSHFHHLTKWLAETYAETPILSYPNKQGEYHVNLTGAALERTTAYAASQYADLFQKLPEGQVTGAAAYDGLTTKIVAIVGPSTLSSYVAFVALQRIGLSPLVVSPRLADDGFAHLLRVVGCHTVLAGSGAWEAFHRVKRTFDGPLEIVPLLSDDEVLAGLDLPAIDLPDPGCRPGYIIHTGGTTGLPKPISFDAGFMVGQDRGNQTKPFLSTLPLYHSFGMAAFIQSLCTGSHLHLLNADRPVTASIVTQALDAAGARIMFTVPYVLKFCTEMDGGVEKLATLDYILAGGAATPDDLAYVLISNGVKLTTMYGQTESGATMTIVYMGAAQWGWLTPMANTVGYLEFENVGGDMYHLRVKKGFPSLRLADRPDGSYGTQDLFRPHPDNLPGGCDTRPGEAKWKFIGRQGDIIVLVNGENADPTPIENAVLQNANVEMALAFGAGHERMGLLVIASDHAANMSKDDLVASIIPDLERGNARAADYAKISPDDIVVKPAGTPFPMTAKMTVQRAVMHRMYAEDIEAHYSTRDTATGDEALTDDDVRTLVRRAVAHEHQKRLDDAAPPFDDDTDFFTMGMDSLQTSLVRRQLLRTIPLPSSAKLATNVVFEFPTVNLLSGHIQNLRLNKTEVTAHARARDAETTADAMVKKYADLVTVRDRRTTPDAAIGRDGKAATEKNHVIVLTGATGYLGAQLLKLLLDRTDVSRVYCLVRTRKAQDHENATQRVLTALDNSELLDGLPSASKDKLVGLSTNLAAADLGLSATEYGELQASVTAVIHNAWSVNFNMSLESFEPNIASVAHLLKLSQATPRRPKPATFVFISSIAAAIGVVSAGEREAEERIYAWKEATPHNGYGQSKWVAEHICAEAAKSDTDTDTDTFGSIRILRVGQVSGDTKHGIWNPAEAIPAMVQSALTAGALPELDDARNTLCWLPSDTTAAVIVDLTVAETGRLSVFHVASPHTWTWNETVLPAVEKAGVEVRVVPQHDWVRVLEESDHDIEVNPPYKLIEHFRQMYGSTRGAGDGAAAGGKASSAGGSEIGHGAGVARLALTQSLAASPSLKLAAPVDAALVERYVRFWLKYWAGEHRSSPRA